ncbi:PorT family protein [Chitinophaga horti]|uniref:PorT family protein n=1 Tax=Chitinophaga horti TaxID=2920382 RepID=A0ABY6IZP2_9BACT|nr:PorT family protein [Chitinophaga horti]UYQ92856.1 PorT family protein [Chitinophaga horti]
MSDHFENKIREKLQEADVPFDQDAWKKMEKKLDAVTPTHKRTPGLWIWLSAIVLLLGISAGSMFLFYTDGDSKESKTSSLNDQVNDSIVKRDNDEGERYKINDSIVNKLDNHQEKIKNQREVVRGVDNPVKPGLSDSKSSTDVGSPTHNQLKKTQSSTFSSNNITTNKAQDDLQPIDNEIDGMSVAINEDVDNHLSNFKGYTPGYPDISDSLVTQPSVLEPVLIASRPLQRRGFALGFAAGPDYSAAPGLQSGDWGASVGLQFLYAFNNRFAVSTGAFYATKIYGATPADYQSNYNFKKVDADCKVLDVPINLHYTLFESGKHNWSAMLGSSSYFMLRETYNMYYNQINSRKYVYENGSQHYFSVLNLGFGYQQQAARHIMWGIQPYAKLPLGGVGHGKVKLTSLGVVFHVNLTQY